MKERSNDPMRALAQAILQEANLDSCTTCIDDLEDYIAIQLNGDEYVSTLPHVAAHLDGCVACSESYALLYHMLLAERTGTLPTPASVPAPDLSFLPARPTLGHLLRDAVQQLGTQLRVRISQPLLDLLEPAAPSALAFRDAEIGPLFAFDLPRPSVAVERLSIAVFADDQSADHCLVQVSVVLPGCVWPNLSGIAVHLSSPASDQQATTDPWGEVAFEAVPRSALPDLTIEVGM